ncbi:MAG TPA: hypothetical protein ENI51_03270 [Candidatus Atribacteria bacterium]|nr:hypothetical protein [Candidatus Atribacteria bacterium]
MLFVNENLISHLKKLQKENKEEFEAELKKLDKELFNEYCDKKHYKDECDPHCVFAYTNTCKYLQEMRKIWDAVGYSH